MGIEPTIPGTNPESTDLKSAGAARPHSLPRLRTGGGADGDRTRDLVNAIHARSQLRHSPSPVVRPVVRSPNARFYPAPWAGTPTVHARLRRGPARTPALQATPALQVAVAGEDAGAPELPPHDVSSAATMERRRPRRPAPHPVPQAGSCRRTVGRDAHGPWAPPAVAGEDAGGPGGGGRGGGAPGEQWPVGTPALQNFRPVTLRAPAPWSAGVLAGLRHTLGPSGRLMPTNRRPGGPRSMRASGGGRRGRRRSRWWWPVRTPAVQNFRAAQAVRSHR